MDLSYGEHYERFSAEVRQFLAEAGDRALRERAAVPQGWTKTEASEGAYA